MAPVYSKVSGSLLKTVTGGKVSSICPDSITASNPASGASFPVYNGHMKPSTLRRATHHSAPASFVESGHCYNPSQTVKLQPTLPSFYPFNPLDDTDPAISFSDHEEGSSQLSTSGGEVDNGGARAEDSVNIDVSSSDIGPQHGKKVRRQRAEADQRQRDVLRGAFAELKSALPNPTRASSRVTILASAATHIRQVEASRESLQTQLNSAEFEVNRLRSINEELTRAVMVATTVNANAHAKAVSLASTQSASF